MASDRARCSLEREKETKTESVDIHMQVGVKSHICSFLLRTNFVHFAFESVVSVEGPLERKHMLMTS